MASKSLCSLNCMSLISDLHIHIILPPEECQRGLVLSLGVCGWMVGYRGWETNTQAMFLRTTLVGTGLKSLARRMSGESRRQSRVGS